VRFGLAARDSGFAANWAEWNRHQLIPKVSFLPPLASFSSSVIRRTVPDLRLWKPVVPKPVDHLIADGRDRIWVEVGGVYELRRRDPSNRRRQVSRASNPGA